MWSPVHNIEKGWLMKLSCLSLMLIATLGFSNAFGAAAKGYVGGSGAEVKTGWATRNFENLKGGFQPIIVYIYDAKPKNNPLAQESEGKDVLGSDELKPKLAKFAKVKIKSDGSDSKNWPEETRKLADNGALLMLMSSDHTMTRVYSKSQSKEERSGKAIAAFAAEILAHEAKLAKAIAEKEKKEEKAHPMPEKKEPDLTIKIDEKKPEPKKGSKAADAKKAGDKVADGADKKGDGKPDMKKAPQDE